MKATDEQNARYIRGCCIDCGKPDHAPGRPRCDDCDAAMPRAVIEPQLKRRGM
jgi:hypothetical protein